MRRLLSRLETKSKKSKKKHKKYEEERIHIVRATALLLIAVVFLFSAVLSVYTFMKTREIVAHADIYRKQRDYACSEETDDRELSTTGSPQLLTADPAIMKASEDLWSQELNSNPRFVDSNPNEPELPVGYRNSSSAGVSASFLHDKVNHTLHTFANISGDQKGEAGWYMEYLPVKNGFVYRFKTSYILDRAKAVIVAEEVDAAGQRRYTDLAFLSPSEGKVDYELLFLPRSTTTQVRFFSQLLSMGSMNIYEESVTSLDRFKLDEPLVTISFDDGWADVVDVAKPILDEFGIKSSQNIIAESFRSLLADYMSLNEVHHLVKEGHEIASHSLRHCNLARLSETNLDYDINASKLALESEFGDIHGLAYPYGSFDDRVEQVASQRYDYVRTTETGFDSLLANRYRLRGVTITPGVSMESFQQLVDTAINNNLWINIIYHRVGDNAGEYAITAQQLRAQLAYVKAKQVPIVTANEAVKRITKQQNETFQLGTPLD